MTGRIDKIKTLFLPKSIHIVGGNISNEKTKRVISRRVIFYFYEISRLHCVARNQVQGSYEGRCKQKHVSYINGHQAEIRIMPAHNGSNHEVRDRYRSALDHNARGIVHSVSKQNKSNS